MEKYYTPTIEEFHVGFHHEYSEFGKKIWIEMEADQDDVLLAFSIYEERTEEFKETYRVKYLDQQDIEAEGWEKIQADDRVSFMYGELHVNDTEYLIDYHPQIHHLGIDRVNEEGYCEPIFWGEVRNRSELQKIMQQLGIK